MHNLKDRTTEFRSIVNSGSGNSAYGQFNAGKAEVGNASAFIQAANKISRAYTSTVPSQLEQLRKLAKNCSLFDERPQQEFSALSDSLKRHLSVLNRNLQDLKSSQPSSPSTQHLNKTVSEHQKALLLILQTWIAQGFKSLEHINEERNEVLKAQRSRKDQFGTSFAVPSSAIASISRVSTPPIIQPQTQAPASPRMRQPTTQDPYLIGTRPNVLHVDTSTTTYNTTTATSSAPSKKYDDHVAIELQDQQQQQALLYQDQEPLLGSLRNRSTALNTLESTINELGTIYQQLAHMVSQQGEVVQRIDMNIEDMSINVQRGQGELARYLRRVSNGRMFIAKLFAALIIFIILMKFIFW